MKKIAFIIGHNKEAKGAVAYNGKFEYDFNCQVAMGVCSWFSDDQVQWFIKTVNYTQMVKNWNPDLIIELHFNSFQKPAMGCEALVLKDSQNSNLEAEYLLKVFNQRFKIKSRGVKKLTNRLERGYRNFNGFKDHTMILFEPCFANFKTADSEKIIGDQKAYAEFLVDYCKFKLGHSDTVNKTIIYKLANFIKAKIKGEKNELS